MSVHVRLARAAVSAAIVTLSEAVRYQLVSEVESDRFSAEDTLVERIMQRLAECETEGDAGTA
ncbi:hypothetical protein [Aurantiacibacter flavus]|uniref:CopG family transcriptional regulator n=1 Tax=Aurantiacibacter flavus TaxID=3145232 RepID=A0ABV0D0Y7_9SPHN